MAGFSMRDLERQKAEKIKETDTMKEQASDIEVNITEVYDVLAALPGGLDKEITDQILAARNAAQAEAGQEGKDLENAQARTNREFENLCAIAEKKIADNTTAVGMLDGIRSRYGMSERSRARGELEGNTERGQQVIKESIDVIEEARQVLAELDRTIFKD